MQGCPTSRRLRRTRSSPPARSCSRCRPASSPTRGPRSRTCSGTLTLAASTLLYWLLWQVKGAVLGWALVSVLLGLGFTFFSGAVEAWLVDALTSPKYERGARGGLRPRADGRRVAMLGGSVAGGVIAQATNLGVPFLMRVGVLVRDFRPCVRADARPRASRRSPKSARCRRCGRCSTRRSSRPGQPAGPLDDARGPVRGGRRHLRVLRAAAVTCSSCTVIPTRMASPASRPRSSPEPRSSAAGRAPRIRRLFAKRTTALILGGAGRAR